MMVAALAAGCVPVETGELGELSFYDPTSYPDEGLFGGHALDETVAVGAAVEIGVVGLADGAILSGVASGAFVVEEEGETVRVRASSAGEGTITVTLDDGTEDRLTLTAEDASDAELFVEEGFLPGAAEHPSVIAGGYALRPDAVLNLGTTPLDADGKRLNGFDLFDWSEPGGLATLTPASGQANQVEVKGLGVAGAASIQTQHGGAFDLVTLASDTPLTLKAFTVEDFDNPIEVTALDDAAFPLFGLVAFDADGRYAHPSRADEQAFAATVISGDVVLKSAAYGAGGVILEACEGAGEVEFSFAGASVQLPITVSSEVASTNCP